MSRKVHRNLPKSLNRTNRLRKPANRHITAMKTWVHGERWKTVEKLSFIEEKPGNGLMKSRKRRGYSPIMKFGTLAH